MSIPRNHHFVSQVHIKNFFNSDKKIFLYDKRLNNFYFKTTSKSIFSEKDLNSKFENGQFDHISLERDLNEYFENDFLKHFQSILNYLKVINYSDEVNEALLYFAKYGVIGEIRNPRHKKKLEETIYNTFSNLYNLFGDSIKESFDEAFAYKNNTKYLNTGNYSEFADKIIELMGDLIFIIEVPKYEKDYFLLPDFCAANRREKINSYFNPDVKEIAYIGLPLSSKIYLHFYSSKIKNISIKSGIYKIDSFFVDKLNKLNFDFCQSKVACENEVYLRSFIESIV